MSAVKFYEMMMHKTYPIWINNRQPETESEKEAVKEYTKWHNKFWEAYAKENNEPSSI